MFPDKPNYRPDSIIKLDHVPDGLDEIIEYYGNPANETEELNVDWYRENTVNVKLPFYLRLSWGENNKVKKLRVHKKVAESMKDALMEIAAHYDDKFHKEGFDYTGGTFNFRYMRGYDELSTHSWGIAIDLLPEIGCLGCDPRNFPEFIVEAFKKRNWVWGGEWDRPDPMHFQACKNY